MDNEDAGDGIDAACRGDVVVAGALMDGVVVAADALMNVEEDGGGVHVTA